MQMGARQNEYGGGSRVSCDTRIEKCIGHIQMGATRPGQNVIVCAWRDRLVRNIDIRIRHMHVVARQNANVDV